MNLEKSLLNFLLIFTAIFFCSCASNGDIATVESLYYNSKNLQDSYHYAKNYADDDFLWATQSGILAYQTGDFDNATLFLDKGEAFYESVNGDSGTSAFKTFASIIVSNGMFEYGGAFYESVFANHYKALNAIMKGDYASARVEFNRANDRHRRAKEHFADYITKRNESISQSISEYDAQTDNVNVNKSYDSAISIYGTQYYNLGRYKAFDGYVNPYISYLSGVFFLTQRDFDKSLDLLKEAYGITSKKAILEDIKILQSRKNRKDSSTYTWIIIEEGQIPKKEEIRLDLPLFFINANILSFNVALPILKEATPYSTHYNAKSIRQVAESFEVATIAPLVANEFEIDLPYIIATSILSSSYKAYLQYLLGEKLGFFGSLAGAVFSYATTNADIRSIRILPLRFYILRFKNSFGDFSLYNGGVKLRDFHLNACETLCKNSDNLIYIRIIKNDIISLLTHTFKGESQ